MYTCSQRSQTYIGLGLMALMLFTRFHEFGSALHLADASWAIFFLAGFYLGPVWLVILLLQAVAIDLFTVGVMGVSGYCITPAYAALQVAHGALWEGGRWLRSRYRQNTSNTVAFAAAVALSVTVAFIVSNTSFYWMGGRVDGANLTQFVDQFLTYYPSYLGMTALYLSIAGLVHVALTQTGLVRRHT